MGVATTSATFFRSLGGSFGTALFGTVLANRLASQLAERLPPAALKGIDPGQLTDSPQAMPRCPSGSLQRLLRGWAQVCHRDPGHCQFYVHHNGNP